MYIINKFRIFKKSSLYQYTAYKFNLLLCLLIIVGVISSIYGCFGNIKEEVAVYKQDEIEVSKLIDHWQEECQIFRILKRKGIWRVILDSLKLK